MKKTIIIIAAVLILTAIPVSIYLVMQNQELRSSAVPATTLSFSPATVTKNVGDSFSLDLIIDPAENQVFVAEFHISFDPAVLEAENIKAGAAFPNVLLSGTVDPTGKASITLGVASQTSPVTSQQTAATITFKAIAATDTPTTVKVIDSDTFVGANGEGATNVLVGSVPAKITVTGSGSTQTPDESQSTPTPTPAVQTSVTPTPTTSIQQTRISILNPADGSIIQDTTPLISGKAPASSAITLSIYPPGESYSITSDNTGNWQYTPNVPLDFGPYDLVATSQDPTDDSVLSIGSSFVIATESGDLKSTGAPTAGSGFSTLVIIGISIMFILTGFIYPSFSK